jgi:hypothetical protein
MACERAKERNQSDEWVRPTLTGMAFDSGDVVAAEDLYDQILQEGPGSGSSQRSRSRSASADQDAEVWGQSPGRPDKLKALLR